MNPLERRILELEKRVAQLERVENVAFIESLYRRLISNLRVADLPSIKLSDLTDVSDTDSASTGQVLKKTSTTWQPGTDNTA